MFCVLVGSRMFVVEGEMRLIAKSCKDSSALFPTDDHESSAVAVYIALTLCTPNLFQIVFEVWVGGILICIHLSVSHEKSIKHFCFRVRMSCCCVAIWNHRWSMVEFTELVQVVPRTAVICVQHHLHHFYASNPTCARSKIWCELDSQTHGA